MMAEIRMFARAADGSETDITEGVQACYDLVIGSMDWGSGFLTVEDALPVVLLAKACGFADYERAEKYVRDKQHAEQTAVFINSNLEAGKAHWSKIPSVVNHDHVYSAAGKCMWPRCQATTDPEPLT